MILTLKKRFIFCYYSGIYVQIDALVKLHETHCNQNEENYNFNLWCVLYFCR